jgi:uncharacterized protein (DUF488 family)
MPSVTTVYTIGHSSRSLAELLALLAAAGIRTLVDVRARPASTRFPHFGMEPLRAALEERDIVYHWAGRHLGGEHAPRADSPHRALEPGGLRGFADYMETESFARGIAQLLTLAARSRTAILCAEKSPADCHRALIADYLVLRGIIVHHLIDAGVEEEHHLDPRARRESAQLVYDCNVAQSLDLGRPG